MNEQYYIGIDLGTSSIKAALFDVRGKLIESVSHDYPVDYPKNGWAEQSPQDWFDASVCSLRELAVRCQSVYGISLLKIELCASIEEVCQKADYLMILAPSNPEKHLEYAQKALAFGKPTYIDKTFAPDYATAREIYDIGEKYGTPFFSSSALRYATELEEFIGVTDIITTGGGRSIEEYCIHQIEMIVKVLQATPIRLKVSQQAKEQYTVSIQFDVGKNATIVYANALPFSVCVNTAEGKSSYRQIGSAYFVLLIESILHFFKDGRLPFEKKETFEVMKIREKLIEGLKQLDGWLDI